MGLCLAIACIVAALMVRQPPLDIVRPKTEVTEDDSVDRRFHRILSPDMHQGAR
jgi:hypothetical protein